MAIVKISALPDLALVTFNTLVPVVDAGANRKMTIGQMSTYLRGLVPRNAIEYTVEVSGTSANAVRSTLYVLTNTTAQTTITFPSSPEQGSIITVFSYTGRTDTVINGNGHNIMGLAENFIIDIPNKTVAFGYVTLSIGWIIL